MNNTIIEYAKEEGYSLAQLCYWMQQASLALNISDEEFEKASPSPEEQQNALKGLTTLFKAIENSGIGVEYITDPTPEQSKHRENAVNPDSQEVSNEQDEVKNLTQQKATIAEINQYVIPLVVDRITHTQLEENQNAFIYEGRDYTAMLRLEETMQILTLDRKYPQENEEQEALLASKTNSEQEYTIIINNITKEEFERFKALFQEEQNYKALNQNQNRLRSHEIE